MMNIQTDKIRESDVLLNPSVVTRFNLQDDPEQPRRFAAIEMALPIMGSRTSSGSGVFGYIRPKIALELGASRSESNPKPKLYGHHGVEFAVGGVIRHSLRIGPSFSVTQGIGKDYTDLGLSGGLVLMSPQVRTSIELGADLNEAGVNPFFKLGFGGLIPVSRHKTMKPPALHRPNKNKLAPNRQCPCGKEH